MVKLNPCTQQEYDFLIFPSFIFYITKQASCSSPLSAVYCYGRHHHPEVPVWIILCVFDVLEIFLFMFHSFSLALSYQSGVCSVCMHDKVIFVDHMICHVTFTKL